MKIKSLKIKKPTFYFTLVSAGLIVLSSAGCSQEATERFAFEQTLKYQLTETCGEDAECVTALEEQLSGCIDKSDYKTLLNASEENKDAEVERFSKLLYACLVDENGDPLFVYEA